MKPDVTVIDYGVGNLHSVVKALRECGAVVTLTGEPDQVAQADKLVLPGVGAFADGMSGLRQRGLDRAIREYLDSGRPFMGICLGMQMLLSESEEFGLHTGLGVIPGRVVSIPRLAGVKVPHVGWSRITPSDAGPWEGTLLEGTPPSSRFYFVHSFMAVPEYGAARWADATYCGVRVCAAIRQGSVTGFQFHPEKSGPLGLAILRKFVDSHPASS